MVLLDSLTLLFLVNCDLLLFEGVVLTDTVLLVLLSLGLFFFHLSLMCCFSPWSLQGMCAFLGLSHFQASLNCDLNYPVCVLCSTSLSLLDCGSTSPECSHLNILWYLILIMYS